MIDLTPVFQAIIALLAAFVTYKLIPWIKAKTTEKQQENLHAAARIAVFAAEQIFGSGQGTEKLDYARSALERAGYNVNTQLVSETIEEIVNTMINQPMLTAGYNGQTHPPEKTE